MPPRAQCGAPPTARRHLPAVRSRCEQRRDGAEDGGRRTCDRELRLRSAAKQPEPAVTQSRLGWEGRRREQRFVPDPAPRARGWHGTRGAARPGGRRYKRSWRGQRRARESPCRHGGRGTERLRARDTARAGGHVAREPRCARGTGTQGRTGRMRHAPLAAAARGDEKHAAHGHLAPRSRGRSANGGSSKQGACVQEGEGKGT
ncbi:hypothetical protein ERJ75_000229800 [Trypanosoma vivax]|nr:hypothetical protein ERJ75_000229800 [Trypanosoma vivax]